VQGRTLGNCEEWGEAVKGLPDGFGTECRVVAKAGRSLLSPGDALGLFVVKKDAGNGNDDDDGLSGGAIAGIVIGVVAVVGVGVGALWFLVIKRGDGGSSNGAGA
jgi:hypothetical protein